MPHLPMMPRTPLTTASSSRPLPSHQRRKLSDTSMLSTLRSNMVKLPSPSSPRVSRLMGGATSSSAWSSRSRKCVPSHAMPWPAARAVPRPLPLRSRMAERSCRSASGEPKCARREMKTFWKQMRDDDHLGTMADSKMTVTPVSAVR